MSTITIRTYADTDDGPTLWAGEAEDMAHAVELALSQGRSLRSADLRRADLVGMDLVGAYLAEAQLRGADLSHALLSGARLTLADLRSADLRGADLRRASLVGASLIGADLTGAQLDGADLRGADLRGVRIGHTIPRIQHIHGAVAAEWDGTEPLPRAVIRIARPLAPELCHLSVETMMALIYGASWVRSVPDHTLPPDLLRSELDLAAEVEASALARAERLAIRA